MWLFYMLVAIGFLGVIRKTKEVFGKTRWQIA